MAALTLKQKQPIEQTIQPTPDGAGLMFKPQSQSLTQQLVKEVDKFNSGKEPKDQAGIKNFGESGYGEKQGNKVSPKPGTGQNELFSAVIAEQIMQDAKVPKKCRLLLLQAF